MLYITFPRLIYFIIGLCLLISLTYFTHPPIPLNPFSLKNQGNRWLLFLKDYFHNDEKNQNPA